jgi:hypothetical protein
MGLRDRRKLPAVRNTVHRIEYNTYNRIQNTIMYSVILVSLISPIPPQWLSSCVSTLYTATDFLPDPWLDATFLYILSAWLISAFFLNISIFQQSFIPSFTFLQDSSWISYFTVFWLSFIQPVKNFFFYNFYKTT